MLVLLTAAMAVAGETQFNYWQDLFGPPVTLEIRVTSIDAQTGLISITGNDSSQPIIPFTWDWGDGAATDGFFPQQHTYTDRSRNRIIEVTAHYAGGGTSHAQAVVFFVAPAVSPVSCPPELLVTIPDHDVVLGAHFGSPLTGLTFFRDSAFPVVPRATIEYVLSLAAMLQMDYANHDVFFPEGAFNQFVLRNPQFLGGMYSLWFTTPVSFGAGDYALDANQVEYSSFFHEMGHNVSLNSPAAYYYGGKTDGNANAIFSESMAQIFQHATAYDLLNHANDYGLDPVLATAISLSAHASMRIVRNSYTNYENGGKHFASWNDPATPDDETFDTFMTLAYVFCSTAEQEGKGYSSPLKGMMKLLQAFNLDLQRRYDQDHDTPEADAFRATLMVAAMSHGFGKDLRQQFRRLNFPIDDAVYLELMQMAGEGGGGCEHKPWPWSCFAG